MVPVSLSYTIRVIWSSATITSVSVAKETTNTYTNVTEEDIAITGDSHSIEREVHSWLSILKTQLTLDISSLPEMNHSPADCPLITEIPVVINSTREWKLRASIFSHNRSFWLFHASLVDNEYLHAAIITNCIIVPTASMRRMSDCELQQHDSL